MLAIKIPERTLAFGPLCFAMKRYVAHIYLSHVLVFYQLSPGAYPRVSHPRQPTQQEHQDSAVGGKPCGGHCEYVCLG